jgi:hypothetical protein
VRYPELKRRLLEIELPTKPVKLSNNDVVVDVRKMMTAHISVLDANPKNLIYMPYYSRLVDLYKILSRKDEQD